MSNFEEAIRLLDVAEQRHRDEAKRSAHANREPVTPEHRQEQFAGELAARLNDARSTWTTFR